MRAMVIACAAMVALASCSGQARDLKPLHNLSKGDGKPQEFAVIPVKPLAQPDNYSDLPSPTPGGANRTDLNPKADAVAILGGNPNALNVGATPPKSDAAVVAQASRFGRDAGIRATLASEDRDFRRTKSRFSWKIVPEDKYNRIYRSQSLEPNSWLDRYRAAGAATPSAPKR